MFHTVHFTNPLVYICARRERTNLIRGKLEQAGIPLFP